MTNSELEAWIAALKGLGPKRDKLPWRDNWSES